MEKSSEFVVTSSIKEMRQKLESRVDALHTTQVDLITSLQSVVPDLVSSLDLSLKAISLFNHRPFTPLAQILHPKPNNFPKLPIENPPAVQISFVRSMVAVCLLERVPFSPIDSSTVLRKLEEKGQRSALLGGGESQSEAILAVEMALRSMAQDNGCVELGEFVVSGGNSRVMVMNIDRPMLLKENKQQLNEGNNDNSSKSVVGVGRRRMGVMSDPPPRKEVDDTMEDDVEALLKKKSFKEMQKLKTGEELWDLIYQPTAKENAEAAKFRTKGGPRLKEYCSALTKENCRRHSGSYFACDKLHFHRIIAAHTDVNLGDCSFLDNCHHMKTCKYVHYELDSTPHTMSSSSSGQAAHYYCSEVELGEPQWINCDIRSFRMDILGQFGVIMADPPWDIHMELPYGTMADDEMRTLNVPALQTDGLIFLWVTGRAMELGRECLQLWGYKRVEEITWVKTNQLQRIIKTGRTGHWLNHSKEHCLVGVKGNPQVNRNIDTNVIVSEVRETSRKPDEMYAMLERLSPRTRKLELFARGHNVQAGWLSLGNQLQGVRLVDEGLRARYKAVYPDVDVQPPSPPRTAATMDVDHPFPPPSSSSSGSPFAEPTRRQVAIYDEAKVTCAGLDMMTS